MVVVVVVGGGGGPMGVGNLTWPVKFTPSQSIHWAENYTQSGPNFTCVKCIFSEFTLGKTQAGLGKILRV